MNTNQHNALTAILDRIDEQIVESDTLLLTTLTGQEHCRVTDELAYLQTERLKAAANLLANRAELAAALADNYLQIRNASARLAGRISDDDRRQTLNQIIGLRKARRELEAKLREA